MTIKQIVIINPATSRSRTAARAGTKTNIHIDSAIIKDIIAAQRNVGAKNLEIVHPNMELIQKMIKITENYIKENKRIVYGGTAIEAFLEAKGIKIYHDPAKYLDYDFYTPNNEMDSIAIANLFHDAGFSYSRRVLAIHPNTYRVSAEFTKEFIADATFIPEEAYKTLPKTEINGLLYVDPQFLKIDLYTSVSNSHMNVYRWEKSYKRLIQLEALYPLPEIKPLKIRPSLLIDSKTALIIEKYTKSNKDIIIVGTQAYNLYTTFKQPIYVYSFYALDPQKEAKKLQKKLPTCTIANYHAYLDVFPKYTALHNKKGAIIAEWYDIAADCIAITEINKHYTANYHWLLRFLYGKYALNANDTYLKNYFSFLIKSLMDTERNFYVNNETTHKRADANPFKIFQIDCVKNVSIPPPHQTIKIKNWSYKPEIEKRKSEDATTAYIGGLLGEKIIQ